MGWRHKHWLLLVLYTIRRCPSKFNCQNPEVRYSYKYTQCFTTATGYDSTACELDARWRKRVAAVFNLTHNFNNNPTPSSVHNELQFRYLKPTELSLCGSVVGIAHCACVDKEWGRSFSSNFIKTLPLLPSI